jgi:hypothetical protein
MSVVIDGERYYPEGKIIAALAAVYREHGVLVANLCDDYLDRSGRLLGIVRDAVIKASDRG